MTKTQQQIIALAGLFQAMDAVESIAQTGHCDNEIIETALKSIFITNPATTLEVFDTLQSVELGLKQVKMLLGKRGTDKKLNAVRYALAIIQLERKLSKQDEMLSTLSQRLNQVETQIQHFGLMHENVIASIADTYTNTISTFNLRVQISGQERFLTIDRNAAKIRTLLLAGIRAAMLWRQLGGHRWHFIFQRSQLCQQSEYLLSQR